MFGYVRPLRGELKVRQLEEFRAVYCGLCHVLGKRYGPLMRNAVNYDLTFLAIALSALEGLPDYCRKRCPASPFKKKCVRAQSAALERTADIGVILVWWKLRDHARDRGGLFYRLLCALARPAYKKAAAALPEYERAVREALLELEALEKSGCASMDRAADTFARALGAAACAAPEETRRPLEQMLYHVGRWIYIMDAFDDLKEDLKTGSYNPLKLRYDLRAAPPPPEITKRIALTASHSLRLAGDASLLLAFGESGEVMENILFYGLPFVQKQVLAGQFAAGGRKKEN